LPGQNFVGSSATFKKLLDLWWSF